MEFERHVFLGDRQGMVQTKMTGKAGGGRGWEEREGRMCTQKDPLLLEQDLGTSSRAMALLGGAGTADSQAVTGLADAEPALEQDPLGSPRSWSQENTIQGKLSLLLKVLRPQETGASCPWRLVLGFCALVPWTPWVQELFVRVAVLCASGCLWVFLVSAGYVPLVLPAVKAQNVSRHCRMLQEVRNIILNWDLGLLVTRGKGELSFQLPKSGSGENKSNCKHGPDDSRVSLPPIEGLAHAVTLVVACHLNQGVARLFSL